MQSVSFKMSSVSGELAIHLELRASETRVKGGRTVSFVPEMRGCGSSSLFPDSMFFS